MANNGTGISPFIYLMSDNFSQGSVCELLNRDYRADGQPATDRLAVWTISVGVCFVCVSSAIHIPVLFIVCCFFQCWHMKKYIWTTSRPQSHMNKATCIVM